MLKRMLPPLVDPPLVNGALDTALDQMSNIIWVRSRRA
jgi:hypothetical protein